MKNIHAEKSAQCVKAIANPFRLSILSLLAEGEKNVREPTRALGTSQSNVSQHLFRMRGRDLVTTRREGNRAYYTITNPQMLKWMASMKEVFRGEWPLFLGSILVIPNNKKRRKP